MIEIDNKTSLKVNEKNLNKIATSLTDKNIELLIVAEDEIKIINKNFRNINKSTDVLSFPYEEMPMTPLGSIVISASHVQNKSNELNHTCDEEFALLFIHGVLHLLGYDHEIDKGQMREKEAQIIEEFNLPKSLIVRSEEDI
jgi:probable rRNA maturation factor